ncbi:hypothetical protein Vretimale_16649 [Volvox reticuliferus]|uniref:Cytidyltransferase-like domain-containing protein n=1 Tax=Volvox reticuliferus TaxID=1737510 RepID=A0A8J4FWL7_9CHLO|nr:hypothetical protein Vretifemale_17455 [Volvox reticuliferus]GIM13564.1 hypothetical protein Vretimale_16649 [Volvox reticuliferus]
MQKLFTPKRVTYSATAAAAAVATIASLWEYTGTVSADGAAEPLATKAAENMVTLTKPPRGEVPLPTDKLSCKMRASAPRNAVVLVCCGSFNPPTVMHMRMVDLAGDELMRRGYDVWGAYLSPVADAYGKPGLAPAADRVAMCRLAADDESARRSFGCSLVEEQLVHVSHTLTNPALDMTMVYEWEARQPGYTRTLTVLRRVESELKNWWSDGTRNSGAELTPAGCFPSNIDQDQAGTLAHPLMPQSKPEPPLVRAMLLCGGDVLESMAIPGVWRDPDVILREHGVVCIAREGTNLEQLINCPGSILYDFRDRIIIVYDKVGNSISSSKVRQELATGRPVRYLVPRMVLSYIYQKGLYGTSRNERI